MLRTGFPNRPFLAGIKQHPARWQRSAVCGLGLTLLMSACGDRRKTPEEPAASASKQGTSAHGKTAKSSEPPLPDTMPRGLLLSLAHFGGERGTKPLPARVELLWRARGQWQRRRLDDEASNVFHKALSYRSKALGHGVLTLGGSKAAVKFWRWQDERFVAQTLWQASFGGKFDRMRDAELFALDDDKDAEIAVGTHDQGVVALLDPDAKGRFRVRELDKQKDTFIHEIEVGDLNGDGKPEIYATPSEPNRIGAAAQRGRVVRYDAARNFQPEVVAELGNRHAKEILVSDVDGDKRDELYVVVEALTEGKDPNVRIVEPVEIRRFDADTPADAGIAIATVPDRLCRFLTAGDLDGDGKKELVAAAFRSGVWWLKPGKDAKKAWSRERIDSDSAGFEHAALLTDLDGDGREELYVAADEQHELRRYVWHHGRLRRSVVLTWPKKANVLTWNLTAFDHAALFKDK
ncbi:MAG: FG-GAP repeat domain-containing protein [Polyangiales bacterium]